MTIKFTDKKTDGALTVTKDTTAATLSAKSFFSVNKIDLKNISGRYDWKDM